MTTTRKVLTIPALAALMIVGGSIAGYTTLAAAQESNTESLSGFVDGMRDRAPHIGGEITAINGTTITVSDMRRNETYVVDASGATFMKDGESVSIASFAVGDKIHVKGAIDGTNVAAEVIHGGMDFGPGEHGGFGRHGKGPGVMGEVTAVNGTTVTVTGKNGTSYTVDASAATVQKIATGSLSDIVVGDRIGVRGDVSGTSVTATSIMDDLPEPPQEIQ